MNTEIKTMYEWKDIPWRKLERIVFKLQKRIYQATNCGDVKKAHKLQRLLMNSWSAKCLAIRRVTQDNQGKKTAGVDGVKSLSPESRMNLVGQLKLTGKSKPVRRVWIPKPKKDEYRPLGIPVMFDRALQALVKMAMEPEWEAKFEPNSYGFRIGRSCHDAIEAIFTAIKQQPKWILDADISKCFDKINHQKLLLKLNTYPQLRRQVKSWLKAGVVDGGTLFSTFEGTPQGGVISPLLANIALHGLEQRLKEFSTSFDMKRGNGYQLSACHKAQSLAVIKYADDFVVIHKDKEAVLKCKTVVIDWLKDMGLELNPSKTRLCHTLEKHDEPSGFNFLGFNVRQYMMSNHRSGKDTRGKSLGFKTLIKPSKEAISRHYRSLKGIIRKHRNSSQERLILALNPVIRGWCNYYRTAVSADVFGYLDHLVFLALRAWAKHRHPNEGKWCMFKKYWRTVGNRHWVFGSKGNNPLYLLCHASTEIVRHVKVKGEESPYNGKLAYWSTRMGNHPEMPKRVAKLLKQQKGKCSHCGLFFKDEDVMEIDHILPRSLGGKDEYKNFQLLHRHCHDKKTCVDGSSGVCKNKSSF